VPEAARHVDYLLIGGFACGVAARALRELAPSSSILLVAREPDPPYERPPCSKGYLQGAQAREEAFVEAPSWYDEHRVELLTRTSVTRLDPGARTVELSTRESVSFERALLATGANVRRLHVEGSELDGIHYLRTLANADAIRADLEDAQHVVMIGGSYIGCEVAASLALAGRSASIVMLESQPFERTFGPTAGAFFGALLREHGIAIHGGDELARFEGDGRVQKVVTRNGLELPAELVVIGAGVMPEVHLASAAGLKLGERGGVRCDAQLQSSAPGIFAAGDICEYDSPMHGGPIRVEHWDVAYNQGAHAARNMAAAGAPYETVPYFFSDLADWVSLEYVGPAYRWDEEVLRGSFDEGSFTNFYLDDNRLAAALTVGRSDDLEHARRLIAARAPLDPSGRAALADPDADLAAVGPAGASS
jgi:3-phenylpropionate/trans-cinnamate dioxygenase ferredoxin reductase subunit